MVNKEEELKIGSRKSFEVALSRFKEGLMYEKREEWARSFNEFNLGTQECAKVFIFMNKYHVSHFESIDLISLGKYVKHHSNLNKVVALMVGASEDEIKAIENNLPSEIIYEKTNIYREFSKRKRKRKEFVRVCAIK